MSKPFFLFLCFVIAEHIDTIIFDFGGVLINIDYQRTIAAFQELGIVDFEERYSQAEQKAPFNEFEVGKISSQCFINEMLQYVPAGISANKVVHAWNAMILDVPLAVVELLMSLQGKYRIFVLSNTNEIHLPKALAEWKKTTDIDFYSCFEQVYLSHEIGLRKPDEAIFRYVCEQQSIIPANAVFIDDSIQHIEGARKVGLNTVHLLDQISLSSFFS